MSFGDIEDAYALTPVQKGILYHCLDSPDTDVYISYVTIQFEGQLRPESLELAWLQTIQRHAMLRTGFAWDGLDEPLQVISTTIKLDWQVFNWTQLNTRQKSEQLKSLIATEKQIPFDLLEAPLCRFRLVQLEADQWTLVWVVHHLLADGWSTPIILEEVLRHYDSIEFKNPAALSPVFRFSDYVEWLQNHDSTASLEYWSENLSAVANSPIKCYQASNLAGGDSLGNVAEQLSLSLSAHETSALIEKARQNRLTLATVVHSAWALVLRDYADSDDLLFGTTVSGRDIPLPGVETAVGLFFNTVPLAVSVQSGSTPLEWMLQVQANLLAASKHSDVSMPQVRRARNASHQELDFESIVVIESHDSELSLTLRDQSLKISNVDYQTYSNYPVALLAYPGEELQLTLVFNKQLFTDKMVNAMLFGLRTVLTTILAKPHVSINHYQDSLASEASGNIASEAINASDLASSLPSAAILPSGYTDIVSWFESTCDKFPNDPALICDGEALSFRQLDLRANQIAHLVTAYVTPNPSGNLPLAIGLCLPRGLDQIAALLGILKAGYAYIPIDPDYPIAKIHQLLELADAPLVVGAAMLRSTLAKCETVFLDVADSIECSTDRLSLQKPSAGALAYIMFTSGSTGVPKGVCISHENLAYSTQARLDYYAEHRPRYLLLSSISFDSSVAGIFWSLCGGGTLILPLPDQEKDLHVISDLIRSQKVTHTLCLATLYSLLLEHSEIDQLQSLSTVIVAGESCQSPLPQKHFSLLPDTRLFNEYGPTEACVWSTVHELSNESCSPIPIGHPLSKTCVQVVNSRGALCPKGIIGELLIGGPGVAHGYHNNPEATIERFKTLTIDGNTQLYYLTGDLGYKDWEGNLVFVGRKDRQIKIRGFRIEPNEIESVITRFPGVHEAVVVARELPSPSSANPSESNSPILVDESVGSNDLFELLRELPESTALTLLSEVEKPNVEVGTEKLQEPNL